MTQIKVGLMQICGGVLYVQFDRDGDDLQGTKRQGWSSIRERVSLEKSVWIFHPNQ